MFNNLVLLLGVALIWETTAQVVNYVKGVQGTNECPAGSSEISTKSECENDAATALEMSFGVSFAWSSSPKGCLTSEWDGRGVFFNEHATGTTNSAQARICKTVSSSSEGESENNIYEYDGKYGYINEHPICGHMFWNNNIGAAGFCAKLGYTSGTMTVEGKVYDSDKDSIYVGTCVSPAQFPNCAGSLGSTTCGKTGVSVRISCTPIAPDCTPDSTTSVPALCKCGDQNVRCAAGKYCFGGSCETEAPLSQCTSNENDPIADNACTCNGSECAVEKFCYDNNCNDKAKPRACVPSINEAISKECICEADGVCVINKYCYDDKCKDEEKNICEVNYHKGISTAKNNCHCGTSVPLCAVDDFCYDDKCNEIKYACTRDGRVNNIFFGAKVEGEWLHETNVMKMKIAAPRDIVITRVSWLTPTTHEVKANSILNYNGPGQNTRWKEIGGNSTAKCKTFYELEVPTSEFFGDGSDFKLVIDKETVNEKEKPTYELDSALKVVATEQLTYKVGGNEYPYTRTIQNTVPIVVKLKTASTITVNFKMIKSPAALKKNFLLLTGAEEDVADDTTNKYVEIKMISYSVHGIAPTDGIKVKTGGDKITGNSTFTMNDANDLLGGFDKQQDLIIDYITWKFVPSAEFLQNKGKTLTFTLEFTDKTTNQKWSAEADIIIATVDVMTEVGFQTAVTLHGDPTCTNGEKDTFTRGDGIWVKIALSQEVISFDKIECTVFDVIQKNEDGTGDVKHTFAFTANKDFYDFEELAYVENGVTNKNVKICGGELNAKDMEISSGGGYMSELKIEVTVTYEPAANTIVRRILSLTTASDWRLTNPEQYTESQIEEAEEYVAEHGNPRSIMPEFDVDAEIAVGEEKIPNKSDNKVLTKTFYMVDRELSSEVEVGSTNLKVEQETHNWNLLTFATFGTCIGFITYIYKNYRKPQEYIPLLD